MKSHAVFIVLFAISLSSLKISAAETGYFYLANEPLIRIGLTTNASSVAITTADSQLVAASPDEASRFLATNKITVSARSYRPPEIEIYRFEIPNIETQAEAENLAKEIREATNEKAFASSDFKTNTWRVAIGDAKETVEEADEYKLALVFSQV